MLVRRKLYKYLWDWKLSFHLPLRRQSPFPPANMKFLALTTLSLFFGVGLAAPTLLERSTCQLGSIGPANAGDAACSASVRCSSLAKPWDPSSILT